MRHVAPGEADVAGIGFEGAADLGDQGGFARAVGADHRVYLAGAQIEADVIAGAHGAEGFA